MPDSTRHLRKARAHPALLSFVIPCYNESPVIPYLRRELTEFLSSLPCQAELIVVNDGSSDNSLDQLMAWAELDGRLRVVQLSRNFGQDVAITAGLDFARGEAVVLMDADLQDPLPVVKRMIAEYCAGYDVVYGQRNRRAGESVLKRASAWLFYRLMRALADKNLPPDVGNFRLISRACLRDLARMRETHRFLRGMIAWVGYPQTSVRYQRAARAAGATKYPLGKMLLFAWSAAVSFSTTPLNLSFFLGGLVGLFALEEGGRALLARAMGWYVIPGWTSLMVVVCLIGSSLLISIGILGQYVARLYEQAKGRPLYVVSQVYSKEVENAEEAQGADLFRAAVSLKEAEKRGEVDFKNSRV